MTVLTATAVQKPFTIREFTLDELMEMKTSTSNEQTPINPKAVDALRDDFRINPMVKPFSVAVFDGDLYLAGGRHRRHTHHELGRPGNTVFQCIFYEVDTALELNELIIQDNAARRSTATEKRLLRLGGQLGKVIGQADLTDVYVDYILVKDYKNLYSTLKTDIVARLLNADETGNITETMMPQLVNAIWVNTLGLKKYANYLYLLTYDVQNVDAFIEMTVNTITKSFKATMDSHAHITRWARDGKAVLIDRASAAMRDELPKVWKVLPPTTQSKATKSNTAPVATVTVAQKQAEANAVQTPVVEVVEVVEVMPVATAAKKVTKKPATVTK